MQAKFYVPSQMYPGLARAKEGRFPVGTIFAWPDRNEAEDYPPVGDNPSLKLIPVNQEAWDLLCSIHGDKKVKEAHPAGVQGQLSPLEQSGAPEPIDPKSLVNPGPIAPEAAPHPGENKVKVPKPKKTRASDAN